MAVLSPATRVALLTLASFLIGAPHASAAVTPSILTAAEFPTGGSVYLFNPNIAETADTAERTISGTRLNTQTFIVNSTFTLQNLYILQARPMTGMQATIRIYPTADTKGQGILAAEYDAAIAGGFLFEKTFTMPEADPLSARETLKIDLTGADQVVIPATTAPTGYALTIIPSDGVSNVFTWRAKDTTAGVAYPDGRSYYDDLANNQSSRLNRDFIFAMNGTFAPPSTNNANFNETGAVDGADLALWKTGFGTATGATHGQGDANGDGAVDGTDFLLWQRQLGTTPAVGAAASSVPEPSTLALAALGVCAVAQLRRRSA